MLVALIVEAYDHPVRFFVGVGLVAVLYFGTIYYYEKRNKKKSEEVKFGIPE